MAPAVSHLWFICAVALALASSTGCDATSAVDGTLGASYSEAPPAPTAGCGQRPWYELGPFTGWRTVKVDGRLRWFWVHIPDGYERRDPAPTPLVVSFHGRANSPLIQRLLSKLTRTADDEGFIAVFPKGTGFPLTFNAGNCCGDAADNDVDDVGFTDAMLDALEDELCIDARRVYANGFSNGGYMAQRLACERSERFAAVATVAGALALDPADCQPARPVPVWHAHGTADEIVLFEGEPERGVLSVRGAIERWREINGCSAAPILSFEQGDARCELSAECASGNDVELCVIDGGGHTWPGGLDNLIVTGIAGEVSQDLDASSALWAFLRGFALP